MLESIQKMSIDNPEVQEILHSINNIIMERIDLTQEAANQDTRVAFANTSSTKSCYEDLTRDLLAFFR